MRILALDTSSAVASVAAMQDGIMLCEFTLNTGLTHSQTIMPLLDRALCELGLTTKDMDAFAVCVGPGSFTGVRIGVCAANAMALAHAKPVVGVDSLELLYHNVPYGRVCCVLDARAGNVYAAIYEDGKVVLPPTACTASELAKQITGPVVFVGDGAKANRETLSLPGASFSRPAQDIQRSLALALIAHDRLQNGETVAEAMPLYLRKPQAERMLEARG